MRHCLTSQGPSGYSVSGAENPHAAALGRHLIVYSAPAMVVLTAEIEERRTRRRQAPPDPAAGGCARAANRMPEERSASAPRAADTRWRGAIDRAPRPLLTHV